MNTSLRNIALAAIAATGLAATALIPSAAVAVGGRGFSGAHAGGGWHGGGYRGGYRGGYAGGYRGGYWGHRGWGPGVFWGGVGLGLGVGAIGYYDGWWGGPYAYAPYAYDDGYYIAPAPVVASPPAPVVVDSSPRSGASLPQAGRAPDPIFYPNKGQSAETTEADRRDCNRWATTQSGAMSDASVFQRATLACMEGRGYTVR